MRIQHFAFLPSPPVTAMRATPVFLPVVAKSARAYQCTVPEPIVIRLGPKDRITFKVSGKRAIVLRC